jgi:hypothetical protein
MTALFQLSAFSYQLSALGDHLAALGVLLSPSNVTDGAELRP